MVADALKKMMGASPPPQPGRLRAGLADFRHALQRRPVWLHRVLCAFVMWSRGPTRLTGRSHDYFNGFTEEERD